MLFLAEGATLANERVQYCELGKAGGVILINYNIEEYGWEIGSHKNPRAQVGSRDGEHFQQGRHDQILMLERLLYAISPT